MKTKEHTIDSLFKMMQNLCSTRVGVSGGDLTSLACAFLLYLLPVVFGWVALEPKPTYYFTRHIHSSHSGGFFLH